MHSIHSTAGANIDGRWLFALRARPFLKGRHLDRRSSARCLGNDPMRNLTPVEAAHANRALLLHAGVCCWVAAKAAPISDDRPDKWIAVTPGSFNLAHQHAANGLGRIAEKFGHSVGHLGISQYAELENPPICDGWFRALAAECRLILWN